MECDDEVVQRGRGITLFEDHMVEVTNGLVRDEGIARGVLQLKKRRYETQWIQFRSP